MIVIKINDKKEQIKETLKNNNIITIDGEIVKIHDDIIEKLFKEIISKEAEQNAKDNIKIENYKKYIKEKSTFQQAIYEKLGSFYFNFYNSIPCKLDRQYKFRFLFLCTYLKYGDDRLQYKQENRIYKIFNEGDLMKLLKLKKTEYSKTKKELLNSNLISIDKDSHIHINNNISTVGAISKYNQRDYTRVFKDTVRELYNKSEPRQHKQLGLFIDLLPYIHFKFNIICKNPTCELMEDIQPLTPKELAEDLKLYTGKNVSSFKRKLLSIHIGDKEGMLFVERFNKKFFVVNPLIYYKGTKIEDLNYLIELFKI